MSNDSMKDETDDFLNDTEGKEFLSVDVKPVETTPQVIPVEASLEPTLPQDESTDSMPELMGTDYPPEYIKIVERVKFQYKLLPSLNYDLIYRELSDLSVKSSPTPTLEVLSDELHKVQAAKDRLSEILIDVIKCYNFKKRAVDILKDSWGKFTLEKNTEGRKGDATFRLSYFLTDFSKTESLSKACDHIFKNLDGLQDNLSRRITIWQLLLKLREGRMSIPDYDFDKEIPSGKLDELFSDGKNKDNEGDDGEIKLREF